MTNKVRQASEKTAFIIRCDLAAFLFNSKIDQFNQNIDDFLLFIAGSNYELFSTSFLCSHYNKLQQNNRNVFKSGIRNYWKRLKNSKDIYIDR